MTVNCGSSSGRLPPLDVVVGIIFAGGTTILCTERSVARERELPPFLSPVFPRPVSAVDDIRLQSDQVCWFSLA